MTGTGDAEENTPGRRFARSMERALRIWLWCLGGGFVLALFGISPTAIGVIALSGPIWMVILVLVFWGRMLDETMRPKSDMEDGPR